MSTKTWGVWVCTLMGAWVAEAQQATFTVTATAGFTQSDYVLGTDYTFIFEVGGFGVQSASSTGFAGGDFLWVTEQVAEGPLWSAFGGTGFVTGGTAGSNPDDYLGVSASLGGDGLYLRAGKDDTSRGRMGLISPGAAQRELASVTVDFNPITGLSLPAPASYVSPGDYFSGMEGSYANATGTVTLRASFPLRGDVPMVFAVKALEIAATPAAVPEPAATGALAGLAVLAATLGGRRRG